MATLHFELVSPERVLFSGEVEAVLLPGHAPVMTALKAGFVVITNHAGEGERTLVRGGFAEINATGLTVLAQRATPMQDVTPDLIEREMLEARMLRDGSEDFAVRQAADATIAGLEEARAALRF